MEGTMESFRCDIAVRCCWSKHEIRCAVETVDGLACSTENIPEICKNLCKQNNSIRKFDSVFKMLSESAPTFKFSQFDNRATFKFDNQPAEYYQKIEVYRSEVISIKLKSGLYILELYNEERDFSETDISYSYTKFGVHVHTPEVIRSKLELLICRAENKFLGTWRGSDSKTIICR